MGGGLRACFEEVFTGWFDADSRLGRGRTRAIQGTSRSGRKKMIGRQRKYSPAISGIPTHGHHSSRPALCGAARPSRPLLRVATPQARQPTPGGPAEPAATPPIPPHPRPAPRGCTRNADTGSVLAQRVSYRLAPLSRPATRGVRCGCVGGRTASWWSRLTARKRPAKSSAGVRKSLRGHCSGRGVDTACSKQPERARPARRRGRPVPQPDRSGQHGQPLAGVGG